VWISATNLRRVWYRALDRAHHDQDRYVITLHGQPTAALVPLETAAGNGVIITKHGMPWAALVKVRLEQEAIP
jgi:prevent-host-death family protein